MSGNSASTSRASVSPKPGRGVSRRLRCSISSPLTGHGQSPKDGDDRHWRDSVATYQGSHPARISSISTVSSGKRWNTPPNSRLATRFWAACSRWVLASRISPPTPAPSGRSQPMSAHLEKSASVLPTWITATMPSEVAAAHTWSQSGWPGGPPAGAPRKV